ncbi:hypothetical protein GCM10008171_31830 [Methylopila jiangsuensis]|uniref:Protamine-2 (Modular protein) n=1 Tax=Methylopila jiangsuensis TaxID=586230 RepID=A0A9W6JLJ2_9HYPH|nr:hypothetical protein [Methylopila jiangsuensis]MDR6284682.1 hypothetical protein [Methylopila jiangsuensis]GLK77929.1 hypothetical protein GCM10008171_31830 [Methylopila jiangsuensis]
MDRRSLVLGLLGACGAAALPVFAARPAGAAPLSARPAEALPAAEPVDMAEGGVAPDGSSVENAQHHRRRRYRRRHRRHYGHRRYGYYRRPRRYYRRRRCRTYVNSWGRLVRRCW